MARGARFDASFLDDFSKRSAGWGGKITDATAPITGKKTKTKALLEELMAANDSGSGSHGATKPKKKAARKKSTSKKSPHRRALERLARKPELITGRQEHYLQVHVFDWLERNANQIYELFHATPNGGARATRTAVAMRAEGQKAGYPDVSLDAPRGIYHGLRIELKAGTNKPTEGQITWLNRLHKQGYCCAVFNDWRQAVQYIVDYWNLSASESMPPQETDCWWLNED